MKISYLIFAGADLLLLALTAVTGLIVEARTGYARHVLLGMLSGIFTCFVHIVFFMYFVVQLKIIGEAISHHGLDAAVAPRVLRLKSLALRWAAAGMGAIVLTAGLGAAIDTGVPPSVHMLAAFATLFIEAGVFFFQYALLDEYRGVFKEAFGEE